MKKISKLFAISAVLLLLIGIMVASPLIMIIIKVASTTAN
jgi:hypothetical protein